MKKNLIIRISNELGNQLFMYASAYGISKEINRDLFIDDTTAYDSNKNISKYALNNFNISSEVASGNLKFQSLSGYIKRKLLIKTDFLRKRKFFYIEKKDDHKQTNFNNDYKNILFNNDLYVEGYFESEKYFVKCRDQIINEFKFKNSDLYKNNPYFKNLIQSNSVAICVRQNRFIEGKNNNSDENKKKSWNFTLEQIKYINNSAKIIKSKISNAKFFLWSNDFTNLQSELFNFSFQSINLSNINDNSDKRILSLYLLTQCKHYILTTSSFNWWGAWLSSNENKIIIRPSSFKNFTINNLDLWPDNWISI